MQFGGFITLLYVTIAEIKHLFIYSHDRALFLIQINLRSPVEFNKAIPKIY